MQVLSQKEASVKELDCYKVDGEKYLKTLDDKLKALQEMSKGLTDGTFKLPQEDQVKAKEDDGKKDEKDKPKPESKAQTEVKKGETKETKKETPTPKPALAEDAKIENKDSTNDAFMKEFITDTSDKAMAFTARDSQMVKMQFTKEEAALEVETANKEMEQKQQE